MGRFSIVIVTATSLSLTIHAGQARAQSNISSTSAAVGDFIASGIDIANTSAPSTPALSTNSGNASVDACFTSWEHWWTTSVLLAADELRAPSTTETYTSLYTEEALTGTTATSTTVISTTSTVSDDFFAVSTVVVDTTSLYTFTIDAQPATTYTDVETDTLYSYATSTFPRPTCSLPASVSQCQDQWSSYISVQLAPTPTAPPNCDLSAGSIYKNDGTTPACAIAFRSVQASFDESQSAVSKPLCTQASIGGALCSSIQDNYARGENDQFFPGGLTEYAYFSAGYVGNADLAQGNTTIVYTWPTSATLGVPSCTLGCGRCAVTGGTVQLIYWAEATTTAEGNVAQSAAVTESVNAAPRTVETFGTTLTSPTLYISYATVYAADGCSGVSSTISNTIVAIPTDQALSSIYAPLPVCDAHFAYTTVQTATAAFNITDLHTTPVPYSVYSNQPWCATYMLGLGCEGTCPTTAPYKPILVVPERVLQDLSPAWSTCFGDIRGVYDPPLALQAAASVIGPAGYTTSVETPATQTASPALALELNVPLATASADHPSRSVSSPAEPSSGGKGPSATTYHDETRPFVSTHGKPTDSSEDPNDILDGASVVMSILTLVTHVEGAEDSVSSLQVPSSGHVLTQTGEGDGSTHLSASSHNEASQAIAAGDSSSSGYRDWQSSVFHDVAPSTSQGASIVASSAGAVRSGTIVSPGVVAQTSSGVRIGVPALLITAALIYLML